MKYLETFKLTRKCNSKPIQNFKLCADVVCLIYGKASAIHALTIIYKIIKRPKFSLLLRRLIPKGSLSFVFRHVTCLIPLNIERREIPTSKFNASYIVVKYKVTICMPNLVKPVGTIHTFFDK